MNTASRSRPRSAPPLVLAAALLWGAVELVALQRQRWRALRSSSR